MYPTTILLVLAAALGLTTAAAIPQGDDNYDTCIDQFGTVFEGAPSPGIAQCSGCAGSAFYQAFLVYTADPGNVADAKATYNTEMAACNESSEDDTYNMCVNEYATVFGGEVTPGPAECSGCAAEAIAAGVLAYGAHPGVGPSVERTDAAKAAYSATMEECRARE